MNTELGRAGVEHSIGPCGAALPPPDPELCPVLSTASTPGFGAANYSSPIIFPATTAVPRLACGSRDSFGCLHAATAVSVLWGWSYSPENLWMPHPWKWPRPSWMGHWSNWKTSLPMEGGWNWKSFKVPSKPSPFRILDNTLLPVEVSSDKNPWDCF